jgi:hypothetical protein
MTDLSPAAQVVLKASLCVSSSGSAPLRHRQCLAAALRAAADQVLPVEYELVDGHLQYEKKDPIREELLAIAIELETTND